MRMTLTWLNVGLRVVMEIGIITALGYWGYQTGTSTGAKIGLAILTPALGFGFWGLVDFRRSGSLAESLRLIQELAVSGVAAFAWHAAGAPIWGWVLGLISIVHHILVYAVGGTLLKKSS